MVGKRRSTSPGNLIGGLKIRSEILVLKAEFLKIFPFRMIILRLEIYTSKCLMEVGIFNLWPLEIRPNANLYWSQQPPTLVVLAVLM